jgi:hypothetical protein
MTKTIAKTEAKTVAKEETKAPVKKGWRIKQYYVDQKAYAEAKAELAKAPNQVQIMMNFFATEFGDEGKADQGRVMCQRAIDKAGLKTVIEPHVLFAYYRAKMEGFGLRLKG